MNQSFNLIPFDEDKSDLLKVSCDLQIEQNTLKLQYLLTGDLKTIHIPHIETNLHRKDELWKETCFELFIKSKNDNYLEFNFSPRGEWNCYHFNSYRNGMSEYQSITGIYIKQNIQNDRFILDVELDCETLKEYNFNAHPCVVIKFEDNKCAFYSDKHLGKKADFHLF